MPRQKKPLGRPMEKAYPPRIDATPEKIARVVLNAGRPKGPGKSLDYRCGVCERKVVYPETLYNDGLCSECHTAATA